MIRVVLSDSPIHRFTYPVKFGMEAPVPGVPGSRRNGKAFLMELLENCRGSSSLWKEILSAIHHVILILDPDGRMLFASDAAETAFGFSPAELKGRNFSLLLTPEDLSCYYPNLLYLARKKQPFEGQIMLVRRDSTRFISFMQVRPHADPSTGEEFVIACIQDSGRSRHVETSGKDHGREDHYADLIKIADGIAHEIRNPLVGIGGFVTRLFKCCDQSETNRRHFDLIMGNLRKIENLIRKVEFFANLPKPFFQETDLRRLIETVAEGYEEKARSREVQLLLELSDVTVMADRELMERAISIFVENAMDAIPANGSIAIRLASEDGNGTIQVADNGKGIAAEDIPFIFNPFFSTKPDGAGIDLAVVKRIAESHGGCVRLESTLGEGTCFYLSIPFERRRSIRVLRFEGDEACALPQQSDVFD
jgi:PAS domain S-box-containing protein